MPKPLKMFVHLRVTSCYVPAASWYDYYHVLYFFLPFYSYVFMFLFEYYRFVCAGRGETGITGLLLFGACVRAGEEGITGVLWRGLCFSSHGDALTRQDVLGSS